MSLRLLLALMFVLAIGFAWFANWRVSRLRQQAAARQLEDFGGSVGYGRSKWARRIFGFEEFRKQKESPVAWLPAYYFVGVESYSTQNHGQAANHSHFAPINNELFGLLRQQPSLVMLTLSGPTSPEIDWQLLRALPQLRWLRVDCNATDADIAHFGSQTKLENLWLIGEKITSKSLFLVDQNPGLEDLYLDYTSIADADLPRIARFSQLKRLSLRDSRVTSAGVAHLVNMTQLEALHLGGASIDDDALPALLQMPGLRMIEVSGTKISAAGRAQLQAASGFRTVN